LHFKITKKTEEVKKMNINKTLVILGVFMGLFLSTWQAVADKPIKKRPGPFFVEIYEVHVEDPMALLGDPGKIKIVGEGFGTSARVELGSWELIDPIVTDTLIEVEIPVLSAGDYRLSVIPDKAPEVAIDWDLTIQDQAIPEGMVAFFSSATCPSGWTVDADAEGRAIVAMPTGGTLRGTVGFSLLDEEDRQHSHGINITDATIGKAGAHNHGGKVVIAGSHNHYGETDAYSGLEEKNEVASGFSSTEGILAGHKHEISNDGTHQHAVKIEPNHTHSLTGGTGSSVPVGVSEAMPYIQLIACKK